MVRQVRFRRVRSLRIAKLFLLIAVIVLAYVVIRYFFYPRLNFGYYEPAYLPPGVSIKSKRIELSPHSHWAELNFRTEDWVYSIMETSSSSYSIGTANQDYNVNSVKPSCSILSSPAKQQFRLCHWIDYGRISVYEVKFIKADTYIEANIPSTMQTAFSQTEIARFVDSFKRRTHFGVQVIRYQYDGG